LRAVHQIVTSREGKSVSATYPKRQIGQTSQGASFDRNAVYERIASVISELRFGTVEITIHDGRVVQIERTEKIRLQNEAIGEVPK
jgi:hypothetical protein